MTGSFTAGLCKSFAFAALSSLESATRPQNEAMTAAQEFEAFMQSYQNMVFSTSMRLVANQAEAEDIAQEVFLKAYERFAELRSSPTAGGWLKKVATNMSLNHLSRYRARWSFFSELVSGGGEDDEISIDFADPSDLQQEVADADTHGPLCGRAQ